MTKEESKSCIGTIEMLQRLAYNIHGVMDAIDADNCKKIIKALEQEPCEDAISRKEVKDIIRKIYVEEFTYVSDKDIETLLREIDKLPSVTPIRPKGKWETGYTYPDGEYWKCSVCKELIRVRIPMHFCPNCSADMRGEKDAT